MNLSFFKDILKQRFSKQYVSYKAYQLLIRNPKSYLYTSGWMQSLELGRPLDHRLQPVPWMNYCLIQFLKNRISRDLVVFEFGCGYSTLFYANRVQRVISVEYDKYWLSKLKEIAPPNVVLTFKEKDVDGAYCRSINSESQMFDIIVVDGWDRINCMKQSIENLSERGVILLDDSMRKEYKEAIEIAISNGFRRLDFEGLKPTASSVFKTTIFYKEGNCLGI